MKITKLIKFGMVSSLCLVPNSALAESLPYEIRLGFAKNDVRKLYACYNVEKGYNTQLEFLFPPLSGEFWNYIFQPKVHVGISINSKGGTNQLYTGFTWSFSLYSLYLEPTFGIDLNDAKRKHPSRRKQALGSPILFRESLSIGYDIIFRWTGYLFIDHISNAHLASVNPGITTIGFKIGYHF